jgi:hypothetical protein
MNTTRTPLFYMANLGSEISRALLEYEKKDFEKMRNSVLRAENIIKKIKEFPEMTGRAGELEILQSIIENLSEKKFELNKNQLLDYFYPFAVRSMQLT